MAARALDQRHRDFNTAAWLLVALILQVGASRWLALDRISVDYFTLWAVPATLSSVPDSNIYSPDNQRVMGNAARALSASAQASPIQQLAQRFSDGFYDGRIDATGSPFAYTLVGLASSGRYDTDLNRFTIVCFIAFVVSIGLFCRLLGFSTTATVVAAVAYSLCFIPVVADLRVSNVNQLQLLFLSAFLWLNLRGRPALAGLVLGMGIVFKPNIAAVLIVAVMVALLDRRSRDTGRMFAGVALGAALAVGAGAAYFGTFSVWGQFMTSLGRTLRVAYPLGQGNYALGSIIADLSGAEVSLLLTAFALSAVLLVLIRTRRKPGDNPPSTLDEQFLTVGLGCAVMLLASRLVWLHYFVLLIPLSLYLLRPRAPEQGERFGPIAACVALLFLSPAADAVSDQSLHEAVMANVATGLLFAAGLHAWWMVRSA